MGAKMNSFGNKNLPNIKRKKSQDYRSIQYNRNRNQSNDGFQKGKLYMDSASQMNNVRDRKNSSGMGQVDEVELNYRLGNHNRPNYY